MEVNPLSDLELIPAEAMPLLVLSDNMRSGISAKIKRHEKGSYNHMMWMVRPGYFASQNLTFAEQSVSEYYDGYRIKLWHSPSWRTMQRAMIIAAIKKRLEAPWYKRLYDPLQIFGIWSGLRWLQIPGSFRICSDHSDLLRKVDSYFNLPTGSSPTQVNKYLTSNPMYEVYGRYMSD